jgi:predicted metal-dependent hydrolase
MNPFLASDLKKFKLTKKPLNLFRLEVLRLITDYTEQLHVQCKRIKLRSLRSRWGSCTHAGVITINVKLNGLPFELLSYVVYHECLHLIYHNHGAEFQTQLIGKFPEMRALNQALKILGTQLLRG